MSTAPVIRAPAGYVPEHAVSFAAQDGSATVVDRGHPLPTVATLGAAGSTPLAGSASASTVAGPFAPDLGRAIWLTLAGVWTGTVRLLRSVDGGATKLPLTFGDGSARATFTVNAQAPVAEESVAVASYWLDVALSSGTVTYRLEQ
ncbi:hypothetical protein [Sphingomonas sp.]|uniref:hypothetical protein n=1 Tax=Sphingomonas sp. TaxID=28214 RepID=UPI003AFFECE2